MKLKLIDRYNYTKGTKVHSWPKFAALTLTLFQISVGGILLYSQGDNIGYYFNIIQRYFQPNAINIEERQAFKIEYSNYLLEKEELYPEEILRRQTRISELIKGKQI